MLVYLLQKLLVILCWTGGVFFADREGRHATNRAPSLGCVDVPQPNPGGSQLVIDLVHKMVEVWGPSRGDENTLALVVIFVRLVVDVNELSSRLLGQLLPSRHRVNV